MQKNKRDKMNILLTCANGSAPIYFAKKMKNKFNVFLVDASSHSIAPYLGLPFSEVPFGNHPAYYSALQKLVSRWKIDCIVPGADEELLHIKKFCDEHARVLCVLPSEDFIRTCLDKKKCMRVLDSHNISHLLPFQNISKIKYPAIIKPIFGRGSRGVHIVKSSHELDGYLKLYGKKFSEVLVQPYAEGIEYTISVTVNNLNEIIGIVPKRIIVKRGITRAAITEKNSQIDKVCRLIVSKLEPRGPFNVQLILHKNKIYIFEINPRLSTTAVLTDKSFFNEIELYLKYYNKKVGTLPIFKNGLSLYRYEDNFFI